MLDAPFVGGVRHQLRTLPQQKLLHLLERSNCHLTRFQICPGGDVPVDCILSLMRVMRDVVDFTVLNFCSVLPDSLFDTVTSENLLPRLEEFSIRVIFGGAISEFLKARWSSGTSKGIRRGAIVVRTIDRDAFRRLKDVVRDSGAEIEIRTF
jgi:hypothetical protein